MLRYVVPGKQYRNLKKGTIYEVLLYSTHTETAEAMILYLEVSSQWRNMLARLLFRILWRLVKGQFNLWNRPIMSFEEKFEESDRNA